ncbi:MAG: bile acid:sodium symporter family protein [Wenzhouxiangella sp.]|nr:bile acid:sodium symporter family protein [Wenzhouxiangella sp.]MDR9453304.1 bile acid:sodium symporter family protein [Wenzhouxiangella sp.]
MESTIVSAVILPLSLFIVMAGIGLSLTLEDFANVIKYPRTVIVGLCGQLILLPLIALVMIWLIPFTSPLVAAGFLIIALAPGGATSNLFTFLAKGEVAASITLTAVISLITPFTIPILAAWFLNVIDPGQIELPIGQTVVQLVAITFVPVAVGMVIRRYATGVAQKMQTPVQAFSLVTLFVIIAALMVENWPVFVDNFATMAPWVTLLVAIAFAGGYTLARMAGVTEAGRRTLSFEIGLQNGTTALLVTATILQIPETTIAPMFYSIVMFLFAGAALLVFSKMGTPATSEVAKG